jgi:hypothetical protein
MSNIAEDAVVIGAGVEAGAGAAEERVRLALMCRTTVTTAATRDNLDLSVDVAQDVGVAEGEGAVGVVEPSSRCVAVGVVDVGVASDDHYHRSINARPN